MIGRMVTAVSAALAVVAPGCARAQATFNTGAANPYYAHVTSLRDMPFRSVVRQQFDYSCGSAALATLLKYHFDRPLNESQVFSAMYAVGDQAKIRQVGFSLLDMKTYLATLGLASDGYRETPAGLAAMTAPAIAVIKVGAYKHFVVVKGVRDGQVLIGDPAQGLKVYTVAQFAAVWNGVLFVIHSSDQGSGGYNRAAEWASYPRGTLAPMGDASLASLTRNLPTLYQITPVRVAGQ